MDMVVYTRNRVDSQAIIFELCSNCRVNLARLSITVFIRLQQRDLTSVRAPRRLVPRLVTGVALPFVDLNWQFFRRWLLAPQIQYAEFDVSVALASPPCCFGNRC